MIQNFEYAHSRILAEVLNKERERVKNKINHIPLIEESFLQIEAEIITKSQSILSHQKLIRKEKESVREQLENNLRKKANLKKQLHLLGRDYSLIKQQINALDESIEIEKQQQVSQMNYIIDLEENIGSSDERIKELSTEVSNLKMKNKNLEMERDIGRDRVDKEGVNNKSIASNVKSLSQEINKIKRLIQEQMISLQDSRGHLHHIEEQIYCRKQCNLQFETTIEETQERKHLKISEIKELQKRISEFEEINAQSSNIESEIKEKLKKKVEVCSRLEGDLATMKSERGILQRDSKFLEHKVECIQIWADILKNSKIKVKQSLGCN